MRIIAGNYGGRIIKSPKKHSTHPMSEKMRGAIFNALGDISGLSIFDAYAGSGAIGIEALSRGAGYVYFTDTEKQAIRVITENTKSLKISDCKITEANCVSYATNLSLSCDIIVADPPYNDIKLSQLKSLTSFLNKGGVYVLSLPIDYLEPELDKLQIVKSKNYGDAKLVFYK